MGSLTKVGTGTLVLSGTNIYGGGTTVVDGTLVLLDAAALADGSDLTVGGGTEPGQTGSDRDAPPIEPRSSSAAPVPEPGTLVLLAAGLLLLFRYRRHSRIA